jgi:cell wall-associated NlpC family hydrolase
MSLILMGVLPAPVSAGWLSSTWPGYDAAPNSEAARVMGAIGPNAFDCSGLVWYAFSRAGLADRMGGKRRGARGYLNWFKANMPGRVSHNLADARPGDILIWGGGRHSGLYISGNWAISALNRRYDIRIHRADPMGLRFTAVLMVDISRTDNGSIPPPASSAPTTPPSASPSADPSSAPAN